MTETKSKQIRKKLAKRIKCSRASRSPRPSGMDDSHGAAGDSAGLAPARAARRRSLCHVGPERPVPPRHQPEQPSQDAAPAQNAEVIIRNEKRMLQEAVDALFDNGRHGRPVTGAGKSLG